MGTGGGVKATTIKLNDQQTSLWRWTHVLIYMMQLMQLLGVCDGSIQMARGSPSTPRPPKWRICTLPCNLAVMNGLGAQSPPCPPGTLWRLNSLCGADGPFSLTRYLLQTESRSGRCDAQRRSSKWVRVALWTTAPISCYCLTLHSVPGSCCILDNATLYVNVDHTELVCSGYSLLERACCLFPVMQCCLQNLFREHGETYTFFLTHFMQILSKSETLLCLFYLKSVILSFPYSMTQAVYSQHTEEPSLQIQKCCEHFLWAIF